MKLLVALSLVAIISQSYAAITATTATTAIFTDSDRLNEIIDDDVGAFTKYLNCDKSSGNDGSIGDFETTRRCRALEMITQTCEIPCEKPLAMECRSVQIHDLTAEVVYKECLSLTDDDTNPASGLYAKDSSTRPDYGGACNDKTWKGEACKEILGSKCDAPDSECRRYCSEDEASRNAYCAQRMKEIKQKRALAVAALKDLVQEKMAGKRGLFQSSRQVRSILSRSLHKKALAKDENEDLIVLSELLKDDTIDWDN